MESEPLQTQTQYSVKFGFGHNNLRTFFVHYFLYNHFFYFKALSLNIDAEYQSVRPLILVTMLPMVSFPNSIPTIL